MAESLRSAVRILLVEDNPDIRDTTAQLLEFAGFEVVPAEGGNQARQILAVRPVDVIVTDSVMPEGDGYSLLDFVRSSDVWRNLPVVMVSAKAEKTDRSEGVRRGADAYLPKPYVSADLVALIHQLIGSGPVGGVSP